METKLDLSLYDVDGLDALESPGLLYFKDIILSNTKKAIAMAGKAERLWPHVKTHKMREMVELQKELGIERFKCATLSEARMLAECGVMHILMAYPLVGPNIAGFVSLARRFPGSTCYALGDDTKQLFTLSEVSHAAGITTPTMIDVNLGMDRTGVPLKRAETLYHYAALLKGLSVCGLHGYDGHRSESIYARRSRLAKDGFDLLEALRGKLRAEGLPCEYLVMGGTPTFPVHVKQQDVYLSPGTLFITDWGYYTKLPDLSFIPGAAVLARVISRPTDGLFTLDIGTKAIASEMPSPRGVILGMEEAECVLQSEEHRVFKVPPGQKAPAVGTPLLFLPTHICPTTALYEYATVISDGRVVGRWQVAARGRSY